MKKIFTVFSIAFCILTFQITKAQNIGIGTNTPHASAALDVTSINSGFLPPRMTLAQRNAIANPSKGLIVFCTDCGTNGEMQFNNGNAWVAMSTQAGTAAGQMMYWNGSAWVNVIPGTYGQSLVYCDGVPTWGGCVPKVSTNQPSNISYGSFTTGGNVQSDGGAIVTAKGICWSTNPNPTVALATKTNDGTGIGTYNSNITGLLPSTTYFFRAYATNAFGTIYGSELTISTAVSQPNIVIGSQVWSTKNLNIPTYRNGDTIPQVTNPTTWANLTTGAWCWYNNDSATYANTYGRLYNWYAVNDSRGLAPQGWHVPTDEEWKKLIKFIDLNADTTLCCSNNAGIIMKSTSGWSNSGNGTNAVGFSGLPSGGRDGSGTFYYAGGLGGFWWSSSSYGSANAWYRDLSCFNNYIYRSNSNKTYGFSVRLLRDTVINPVLSSITTTVPSSVTTATAACGGNVTNDGLSSVTSRGVCWSTNPLPTIALSTKTVDGAGTGAFTSNITGLAAGTKYYVRAYAVNNVGVSYGEQISFTTVANLSSVTIGTQIWTSKNLDVATYRNGDTILQVTDPDVWNNIITGAWCWYNNDSATYAATYGRLYNWYAVNDQRGLAPQGWHVPSNSEWCKMIKYLDPTVDTTNFSTGTNIGSQLKSTTGWNGSGNGLNSSGFNGLPAGQYSNFLTQSKGDFGGWWTKNFNYSSGFSFYLYFNSNNRIFPGSGTNKHDGLSIRLVKD